MSMLTGNSYPTDKREMYAIVQSQFQALTEGERDPLPNMANMSALLNGALEEINWVGFYLVRDDELLLGPFQGKPACIRIPIGRGVCGTALKRRETVVVSDVHAFPGHIACDAASLSEIVVPLIKDNRVLGVLDIDSTITGRFDDTDAVALEGLCALLISRCDWCDDGCIRL